MNATIKGVKAEIHTKYTRRYSYILGTAKSKERKAKEMEPEGSDFYDSYMEIYFNN